MQASYARLETMSPTDYQRWQENGWLDTKTRYFHDNVRRKVAWDLIARLIGRVMGRQIDKAMAQAG